MCYTTAAPASKQRRILEQTIERGKGVGAGVGVGVGRRDEDYSITHFLALRSLNRENGHMT